MWNIASHVVWVISDSSIFKDKYEKKKNATKFKLSSLLEKIYILILDPVPAKSMFIAVRASSFTSVRTFSFSEYLVRLVFLTMVMEHAT